MKILGILFALFICFIGGYLIFRSIKPKMKKIVYLFAAGAMALTACNSEPSYKISGTVEGAEDGKMVYLQKPLQADSL